MSPHSVPPEFTPQTIEKLKSKVKAIERLSDDNKSMIQSGDRAFQFGLVDLAFSSGKSYGSSSVVNIMLYTWSWFPSNQCHPVHIRALKLARNYNSRARIYDHAQSLGCRRFSKEIKRSDAGDLLRIFIEMGALHSCPRFMNWISLEHLSELQLFDQFIKDDCIIRSHTPEVFRIARDALTKKSRAEIAPIFCDYLERGFMEVCKYSFEFNVPDCLSRVRKVIKKEIANYCYHRDLEFLGILIAFYGEQEDLEACLKLGRPDYITGLIMNPINPNIKLTSDVQNKIKEKRMDCLIFSCRRHMFDKSFDKSLDIIQAHCLRTKDARNYLLERHKIESDLGADLFFCSDFEYLVQRTTEISKSQIFRFLNCPRFPEIKHRLREIWEQLSQEAKDLVSETHSYFNIFNHPVTDSRFKEAALSLARKQDIMPALKAINAFDALCETKVALTAHWFYVDEFELEIGTAGYLGLVEVAVHAMSSVDATL
jgi:hypothetical protein